jgi:hypothetical protein
VSQVGIELVGFGVGVGRGGEEDLSLAWILIDDGLAKKSVDRALQLALRAMIRVEFKLPLNLS